jgi:Calcineurin-like phosphoesterase
MPTEEDVDFDDTGGANTATGDASTTTTGSTTSTNFINNNKNINFSQGQDKLEAPDDNTMRILLSTDNHLGYEENDAVRGMDSFAAFEEVLYLAKRFHCDMVLISGDLFHENRPSRRTLYKTMEIIRRYVRACKKKETCVVFFVRSVGSNVAFRCACNATITFFSCIFLSCYSCSNAYYVLFS